MGFSETQTAAVLDWMESAGVTNWNVAALVEQNGRKVMKGSDRARDRAEALKCLPWAGAENGLHGAAIYFRPARWMPAGEPASWPVVFFDDVPADVVASLTRSALVIRTSPGRHHVWMQTNQALTEHERQRVQSALCSRMQADPSSTSGEHFGRLPGFKNHKRGGVWVAIERVIQGPPLDATGILRRTETPLPPPPQAVRGGGCASHPAGLWPALGGWSSDSEREFGYAIGRLRWLAQRDPDAMQTETERLTAELIARAASRGKRDPENYARRTVDAALSRISLPACSK